MQVRGQATSSQAREAQGCHPPAPMMSRSGNPSSPLILGETVLACNLRTDCLPAALSLTAHASKQARTVLANQSPNRPEHRRLWRRRSPQKPTALRCGTWIDASKTIHTCQPIEAAILNRKATGAPRIRTAGRSRRRPPVISAGNSLAGRDALRRLRRLAAEPHVALVVEGAGQTSDPLTSSTRRLRVRPWSVSLLPPGPWPALPRDLGRQLLQILELLGARPDLAIQQGSE